MTRFDPANDPERIIRELERQIQSSPLRTVRLTGARDKLLGLFLLSRHTPLSEPALQRLLAELSAQLEDTALPGETADGETLGSPLTPGEEARLEEVVAPEIERIQHTRLPCALILLQIEGTDTLCTAEAREEFPARISSLLRTALRRSDLILPCARGRFAVVLPGITLREATDCAERIRMELSRSQPAGGSVGQPLAVSLGIGFCQASTRIPASAFTEKVVRELERAREQGGNRICQAVLSADFSCQVTVEERAELFSIFTGERPS